MAEPKLNYERIMAHQPNDIRVSYGERECILYALGIGVGMDPLDPGELKFVYERAGLAAFPTMAVVLGWPGRMTDPAFGIDERLVVDGLRPAHRVSKGERGVGGIDAFGHRQPALALACRACRDLARLGAEVEEDLGGRRRAGRGRGRTGGALRFPSRLPEVIAVAVRAFALGGRT